MNEPKDKPHWKRLRELLQQTRNGKATLYWQDGLPIELKDIESRRKIIDLTKDVEGSDD